MMMMNNKRNNSFTHQEVELLLQLVSKYKDILESKKSDYTHKKLKIDTWKTVENEFNIYSDNVPRTVLVLKNKYYNLKKRVLKNVKNERAVIKNTEGRPYYIVNEIDNNEIDNNEIDNNEIDNNEIDNNENDVSEILSDENFEQLSVQSDKKMHDKSVTELILLKMKLVKEESEARVAREERISKLQEQELQLRIDILKMEKRNLEKKLRKHETSRIEEGMDLNA